MSAKPKVPPTITVEQLKTRWLSGVHYLGDPATCIVSGELPVYALLANASGHVHETQRIGDLDHVAYRPVTLTGLYRVEDETAGAAFCAGDGPYGGAPRVPGGPPLDLHVILDQSGKTASLWWPFRSVNQFRVLIEDVERLEAERLRDSKAKLAPDGPKPASRASQRHRERCRAIAATLWEREPALTIEDVIDRPEITAHGQEGAGYTRGTLRNWIKDLCPNREPGRRRKLP